MPAILTDQLTKHFPPDIKAVDGIDLSIDAGRIFGFLGPNGSGKTTTVRMLTTLLRPTSGRAEVDGLDVARRAGGRGCDRGPRARRCEWFSRRAKSEHRDGRRDGARARRCG